MLKFVLAGGIAATLALTPATQTRADGDFAAGVLTGVIGSAIVNHAVKNQRRAPTTRARTSTRSYRPSLPSTQEGREIQSSLNYFGFDAGTVDGQLGRKSHAAISRYQAYMGYPATGTLSTFEQTLLIDSYNRAQAGGYATQQKIAATPDGTRGLLKTYRAEMAGQSPGPEQVTTPVATVVVPTLPPAATTTTTTTTVTAPTPAEANAGVGAGDGALPNLFGGSSVRQASLTSHCNTVSLLTSSNGGFTTLATMDDPGVALNEQFCLAPTYAIAKGEEMTQGLSVSQDQVVAQCEAYGEQMKPYVAALSLKPRDEVLRDVSGFVLSTGVPTQDLAATAKVCLSAGYRTDNMDVAIGSALLLVTLGETGYAELLGHHLSQGFGTSRRADLARSWYQTGLTSATPVFAPGQPDRAELIRAATAGLAAPEASAPAMETTPKAASLPTFAIEQ